MTIRLLSRLVPSTCRDGVATGGEGAAAVSCPSRHPRQEGPIAGALKAGDTAPAAPGLYFMHQHEWMEVFGDAAAPVLMAGVDDCLTRRLARA